MAPHETKPEQLISDAVTIAGFERYQINRDGQVFDTKRERLVAHCITKVNATKSYVMLQLRTAENQRKTVYLHRLLAVAFLDNPLNLPQVDHRDQNSLNNHLENLRWATVSQNSENRRVSDRATSKYMGVSFETKTGKWRATIQRDGKVKNLGVYADELDAAKAYDVVALELGRLHQNGLIEPKIFPHYAQ